MLPQGFKNDALIAIVGKAGDSLSVECKACRSELLRTANPPTTEISLFELLAVVLLHQNQEHADA